MVIINTIDRYVMAASPYNNVSLNVVMKRYGILNSVSVFFGRNTEVSVSVSVLKSV